MARLRRTVQLRERHARGRAGTDPRQRTAKVLQNALLGQINTLRTTRPPEPDENAAPGLP